MAIRALILVLAIPFLSLNVCWSKDLTLKDHGKLERTMSLQQLERLIGGETITVFEPHESENRSYRGFPVKKLLTEVYGKDWIKSEEILFTCRDGYQPSIPVSRFEKYPGYLVYAAPGRPRFTLTNKLQNNELVELGPFYLVWDNLNNPGLRADGGEGWPYQVIEIDLVDFSKRFPNMAPPEKSSDDVKNGFMAFRKYCMACHSINGEGGTKSVELNYPVSITEYMDDEWLYRWIDSPTSIRYNTTMPPLNPDIKDRDKVIKDIIAYLKAMEGKKVRPLTGAD